jgi:thymidylate synthase (FAD)
MNKIEVGVIQSHGDPGAWMMMLAKLTQRGHTIQSLDDIKNLLGECTNVKSSAVKRVASLPHGTIKRFTPITIAVVGASRRFLAQIRTHQVGLTYVSGSLQYSDYSGKGQFTVPYMVAQKQREWLDGKAFSGPAPLQYFKVSCERSMEHYAMMISDYGVDNDSAGYLAPQSLRNILIIQGNHQAWDYLIRTRGCNRNTQETQYVIMRIWEELLKTTYGYEFFGNSGPDCLYGKCREGKMSCGEPWTKYIDEEDNTLNVPVPRRVIDDRWPLLKDEEVWSFGNNT